MVSGSSLMARIKEKLRKAWVVRSHIYQRYAWDYITPQPHHRKVFIGCDLVSLLRIRAVLFLFYLLISGCPEYLLSHMVRAGLLKQNYRNSSTTLSVEDDKTIFLFTKAISLSYINFLYIKIYVQVNDFASVLNYQNTVVNR